VSSLLLLPSMIHSIDDSMIDSFIPSMIHSILHSFIHSLFSIRFDDSFDSILYTYLFDPSEHVINSTPSSSEHDNMNPKISMLWLVSESVG